MLDTSTSPTHSSKPAHHPSADQLMESRMLDRVNELKTNPLVAGLSNMKALASLVGDDGTNNIVRALFDVYLTSSELTVRQEPAMPSSLVLASILPEAQRNLLAEGFRWVDMALVSGVITEEELEKLSNSPEIIRQFTSRL